MREGKKEAKNCSDSEKRVRRTTSDESETKKERVSES